MKYSRLKLDGVFAPIVTVFDSMEKICYDEIAKNIRQYNKTDLKGYMPLGSNGEFMSLTDEEALQVLDTVMEHRAESKMIVGGCGRESAYKTIEFIRQAAQHGLDMAFVLPPHYFVGKMDADALFCYYSRVADASPIPIVIYNAPKFASGLCISPELLFRLAVHPNIAAMKNSSIIPNTDYVAVIRELNFPIIAGNIGSFFSGLKSGTVGGVLSTASYLPEFCTYIYRQFTASNVTQAWAVYDRIRSLSDKSVGKLGVSGVKAGMSLRGLSGGFVRCPLRDVDTKQQQQIAACFEEAGIPKGIFPVDPASL